MRAFGIITAAVALFILSIPTSWAAQGKVTGKMKGPKKLETYSAIDAASIPTDSAGIAAQAVNEVAPPIPIRVESQVLPAMATSASAPKILPRAKAPKTQPTQVAKPVQVVFRDKSESADSAASILEHQQPAASTREKKEFTGRGAYDPVASDQIDTIAQRLKLVESILRNHARAYDYRIHSVRELQTILARLEGKAISRERSRRQPLPAPAIQSPDILPDPAEPAVDAGAYPETELLNSDLDLEQI